MLSVLFHHFVIFTQVLTPFLVCLLEAGVDSFPRKNSLFTFPINISGQKQDFTTCVDRRISKHWMICFFCCWHVISIMCRPPYRFFLHSVCFGWDKQAIICPQASFSRRQNLFLRLMSSCVKDKVVFEHPALPKLCQVHEVHAWKLNEKYVSVKERYNVTEIIIMLIGWLVVLAGKYFHPELIELGGRGKKLETKSDRRPWKQNVPRRDLNPGPRTVTSESF